MEAWQQSEQQYEEITKDSDINWEEEQADLDFYERKFRLSHRTYRVPRSPKNQKQKFELHRAEIQKLAEVAGLENVWEITYTPSRYEGGFLRDSLQPFYVQDQIVDVMALVKGGKEASVYRCKAHPSVGVDWIAAKVYRPRQFRNLRNDAIYREGRNLLTSEDGRPKLSSRTTTAPRELSTRRRLSARKYAIPPGSCTNSPLCSCSMRPEFPYRNPTAWERTQF